MHPEKETFMQKYFSLFFLILFYSTFNAQTGRISGTILDAKTGETLPGATVLIEGTTKGAAADFDGKFSINNVSVGKVTIVVNYISYTSKKITDLIVKANDVTDVAIQLETSTSNDLSEVEVVVTLNKENNTALVLQQKNNASVSDGISAETIKRSPDRTSSDVLKRISGVTIQDDKFVIIRGLNERYNSSFLNGAPLPSTEPDKKAFAFDLFPSNMLDNIIINKTATPDMPSEFAGGIVQINTKSIPEKNFLSLSTGGGYNSITTGQSKITYEGGKYDILGFDDGSRNLSNEIPSFDRKETWISNNDQARVAKLFKNDWAYNSSKFMPNFNVQLATGYNFKRKEKDFIGVIFSLAYNNTENFYELLRREYDGFVPGAINIKQVTLEREYISSVYQTQTSTGALLNLACKINEYHSISLKNLITGAADNKFITAIGSNNMNEEDKIINRVNSRFFSANQIFSSQLIGDHWLANYKIKINWNAGLSNIIRTVPNFRVTSYSKFEKLRPFDPSEGPNLKDTIYRADISSSTGPSYSGYRVYNSLNEILKSIKLDVTRLFKLNENIKIETKIGSLFQNRDRQFDLRSFGISPYTAPGIYPDNNIYYLTEDRIFSTENMSLTPSGLGGFKAFENTKEDDNYKATSELFASYGMAEIKYTEKLRVITGARFENYKQLLTVKYQKKDSIYVNSSINDILPSLNIIYNLNQKLGLRASYYKTLNRPEFRELAKINWFDPETRLSVAGRPELVRCYIQNFDARLEIYPGRGQLFTSSAFYKYFNSPIERYMQVASENQITYKNANFAQVYGAEIEYRLNIGNLLKKDSSRFLSNLTLFSNLSLIKSEVNVKGLNPAVPDTREMQGQAPYIINSGISYIDTKYFFSLTVMLNKVGEKIYLVGNETIPDRWENSRTVLDLQVTKSFLKNRLEIRLNIKDLLQQDWIIYYKGNGRTDNFYNSAIDFTNFKRNFGSTYSFNISYKF